MKRNGILHIQRWFRFRVHAGIVVFITFISQLCAQPLAIEHDKFLGNVIGNSGIQANFSSYWNQVTPENSGKWISVEIGRDIYQWGGLDAAYQYALANNYAFRHHTLIWGQQQPWWWLQQLDSLEQAQEVEEWIQLVGERYPEMDYIDVVNEPLHAPPQYKEALGGDGVTGWDWIIWSFEKARQYCSDSTKLFLNEYNILNSATNTNRYLEIINLLQERELIDGIGVQGHFFECRDASISTINANLDKLANTGIPIHITEYEVDLADDNAQLIKYQTQFKALWEHPGVTGITLWGYIEGQIWKTNGYLIRKDGSERPALKWLRNYLAGVDEVKPGTHLPSTYTLAQNRPNPFNPSTIISYQLPMTAYVELNIYNLLGKKIATLVAEKQQAGRHQVEFNALTLPSGVYLYRIQAGRYQEVKKMVLLR
jgi:endo-1,4-beta-xylanase